VGGFLEWSRLVGLYPHVDLAAARQADTPRLGVVDSQACELRTSSADDALGDRDNGTFDAASRDTAGDLTAVV
jgi:hypothetical protein